MAWQNWKRQRDSDLPVTTVQVYPSKEQPVIEIDVQVANATKVRWTAKSAKLLGSGGDELFNPFELMVQHQGSGEPWNPAPVNLAGRIGKREIRLYAAASSGQTLHEVIWLRTSRAPGSTVRLDIVLESSEPQPRRHVIHVKRQIPALKAVIAT